MSLSFQVSSSRFQVLRILVLAFILATGYWLLATPAIAGDPACMGVYEPLPMMLDPMTAEMDLPCYNGFPAPAGHPGAIPFYDADGQLNWVASDGSMLSFSGFRTDDVRVSVWAMQSNRSLGEMVMILKDNQMRKGRALSIAEVING